MLILGAGLLWLVWIALTRSLAPSYLLAGGICACLAVEFWRVAMPASSTSFLPLARHPLRFLLFALTLAWRFLRSTLSTSRMILRSGGRGQLMALPLRLEDPTGRFILLNSITLTPSTISLLVEEDLLYIHWLQDETGKSDWREIKESLEARLQRLFEEDAHGDH